MTTEPDNRPYSLRTVGIDGYIPERTMAAYSNHDQENGEWPVFTREQVAGLVANTERSHFQPIWIDELGTYAVVTGYGNSLSSDFDIKPHMDAILRGEDVDDFQGGNGFNITRAERRLIEVDGQQIETFSFDSVGWDFYRATAPEEDFIDPYQQEFAEFVAESTVDIQNGDTTIEAAALEFAERYDLPVGFVEANLRSVIEQPEPQASAEARI